MAPAGTLDGGATPTKKALRLLLVADDGSYEMRDAEAVTALLARTLGARIEAVVVGPRPQEASAQQVEVLFGEAAEQPERAAAAIQRRFRQLGVEATVLVKRGPVGASIVEAEHELGSDVLILGSHESAKLEFSGSGSVLDQVKNHVGSSLLVVRGRLDSVAAAIDGSQPSLEAAQVAAQWAKVLGLPFLLLLGKDAGRLPKLGESSREPVAGDAADALVSWSRQHASVLLVLGSRGLGNPSPLKMGSVSDRVCVGAFCSVLVVRPRR